MPRKRSNKTDIPTPSIANLIPFPKPAKKKKKAALPEGFDTLREYRKQVAALKKKGLISKKRDARKAKPTSALTKLLRRFAPVLKGNQSVYKVTGKNKVERKAREASLREQGFTVANGRVVTSKQETVRNGKVTQRGTSAISTRIKAGDIEGAIREAFRNAKDGYVMGLRVHGNASMKIFTDEDAAIDWIMGSYQSAIRYEKEEGAFSIFMISPKQVEGYIKKAGEVRAKAERSRDAKWKAEISRKRRAAARKRWDK